jgi:hypothetical protein
LFYALDPKIGIWVSPPEEIEQLEIQAARLFDE